MFKDIRIRLALIGTLTLLSLLIVLPKIPVKMDNAFARFETTVGGYNISLFNGKFKKDLSSFRKGLDLSGGIRIVLEADVSKIESGDKDAALESAKEVISRRVNLLGVTEPYVATTKSGDQYRILVEIPGLDNVTEAVKLIGQTAQLIFMEVKPGVEWSQDKMYDFYTNLGMWQDTEVTGADLKGADVVVNQQTNIQNQGPQIRLKFTNEGREKFSELAKRNVGKPIGLFLDDSPYPLSMPIVSEDLAGGLTDDPVISGNFDFESAKNLSIQIRAGALPVPVRVLEQETIGATLGTESVQKSFFAAGVGLLLVVAFLIFKYGKLGLFAGGALFIYSLLTLAIFKIVPVVLTLPGIAGFILSIGMATDANILVFERVKEELFWGKPSDLAIHLGFDRAWNSIKDSNISSLITSFILFQFGSGPVKGFALTLAIGIAVSLFTSIFVVRTFIEWSHVGRIKKNG
ncbi:MAG: protein translocase subunit SecD [Patescibacteria group bacterium]|nr:MAG: protein translocase subunit SecD [Patescibacteria group bacterium]